MWNGEQAKQRRREALAKRLIACAITLQGEHTNDLGTMYPPASVRGEYPHRRTGNLQTSVMYEPTSVAEVARRLEIRVGYEQRAWYILPLIMRGRLSLRNTLARVRSRLAAILGSGGKIETP